MKCSLCLINSVWGRTKAQSTVHFISIYYILVKIEYSGLDLAELTTFPQKIREEARELADQSRKNKEARDPLSFEESRGRRIGIANVTI